MRGEGIFADQIAQMFEVAKRKAGFKHDRRELSTAAFGVWAASNFHCFNNREI
jgi:hypothetical protein